MVKHSNNSEDYLLRFYQYYYLKIKKLIIKMKWLMLNNENHAVTFETYIYNVNKIYHNLITCQ